MVCGTISFQSESSVLRQMRSIVPEECRTVGDSSLDEILNKDPN